MALFKISKGQSSSLPKTYNDGYCYVTTDDGKMYIDTTNTSAGRIVLNAGKADKLAQARKIELAGDATGSVNFDGSSNVKINVTISELDTLQSAIDNLPNKASNGIIIDDKTNTIKHSNTITEGTASEGGTSRTLEFGSSFNIPGVTYDAQGHITGKTGISLTLPPNPNTDTRYNLSGALNSSGQYIITLDPTSGEGSFATVPKMIGATSTTAGTGGLVPAATSANRNKYLRGDGTWATPTNTTYPNVTTSKAGLMTSADKAKLDTISSGAEVNQNAFSHIFIDSTSISAATTTDSIVLVSGENVTLSSNEDTNAITISATDTKYSAATSSAPGLMSADDKKKLDGISSSANKYTLPTATASTLGGVKIGSNITVDSGTISITKNNVTSALGYTPETSGAAASALTSAKAYTDQIASGKSNVGHSHTKSEITDFPSSLKNPTSLTIQGNGTTLTNGVYDGSAAKTVNITPASIGIAYGTAVSNVSTTSSAGTSTSFARGDHQHAITSATIKSALGYTPPQSNTTYTFASGDNNGTIKVTPSSGTAVNVQVKGLNTAAYKSVNDFDAAGAADAALTSAKAYTDQVAGGKVDNTISVNATSGLAGGGALSGDVSIGLPTMSNVTAGSYGLSTATIGTNGTQINIPYITVDTYGRVTSISNKTYTAQNTTYSLPAAGASLGGVKSGGDVSITSGVITVNNNSHTHTIANVTSLQATLDGKSDSNHTHSNLTIGSKIYNGSSAISIAASDLGLASALRFKGSVASSANLPDTNLNSGDVYLVNGKEYAYYHDGTSGQWIELGDESSFKLKQNAVSGATSESGSTIQFVDDISQDTNGVITATTKTVRNASSTQSGLMSSGLYRKLSGIFSGAEVNQNAFSNITVGSTTLAADSKTDTVTLAAGDNITLTTDSNNDTITIASTDTNTTYTFATGDNNGTIKVTPSGGTARNVAVKGLGAAAYAGYGTATVAVSTTSAAGTATTVSRSDHKHAITSATVKSVLGATSTGTAKYFREDGTWVKPPNTNTTYTFATGSTNGTISVTPSNGTATDIAVKGLGPVAYTDADVNKGISISDDGKIGVNVDRGISISDDGNIGHANNLEASTGTIQMTRNSSAATFNLPTIKWDAHGHIVSYETSAYTLDKNTSTSAGIIPACSSPNYVWATNADGVPGWRSRTFDSSDTWHKNTATQEGVVSSGSGHANKVWKTDAKGNPGWRDDANDNTWVLNDATTSGIVAAGIGNANKVWKTDAKGVPAWRNDADTATYPTINRITTSDWRPILMGATSITPGTSVSSFSGKTLYQNENVLIHPGSKAILAQSYRFVDATGAIQPMMHYNDSNIWIGATQTGGGHFKGGVCISTGYNGKSGNPTINISIANSANTGATNYKVLHSKGGEDGGLMNGPLFLQDTSITKGTNPKSTDGQYIGFFDKTGVAARARTGMLYSYVTSGGQSCMKMYAYQFKSGSSANTSLYVAYNADGSKTAGTDAKFYGAVWNDYAEFRRQEEKIEPGYCVTSKDDGKVHKTTKKFEHCEGVVSDTFGFAIGQTEECQTPLAVAGRVLVYCDGDRYDYHAGDVVCAGPEGKVYKMTDEEIYKYPHRIVGTVSEIPEYEIWGEENISVNRRIWINVK